MRAALATVLALTFLLLGFVHVYWALGGAKGKTGAVPHIGGAPAFRPSSGITLGVALGLFLCALLVASVAGFVPLPAPRALLAGLCYALALTLFLRAVGDLRLVGFFKRVRATRFARLDTLLFSPLCLGLSIGMFLLAFRA